MCIYLKAVAECMIQCVQLKKTYACVLWTTNCGRHSLRLRNQNFDSRVPSPSCDDAIAKAFRISNFDSRVLSPFCERKMSGQRACFCWKRFERCSPSLILHAKVKGRAYCAFMILNVPQHPSSLCVQNIGLPSVSQLKYLRDLY